MKMLIPMAGLAVSGLLMLTSCGAAGAYDRAPTTYVRENHYYPAPSTAPAPPPAGRQYAQAEPYNDQGGYGQQGSYGQQGGYSTQGGGYGDQGGYNQGGYGDQGSAGDQGGYGSQGGYGDQGSYGGQGGNYNNQGGGYDQGGGYPPPAADQGNGGAYADGYGGSQQDTRADDQYYDTRYYDRQNNNIDVNYFYGRLSPYGDWVPSRRYGYVWCPSHVSAGWRPYVMGHWAMTDDYGWMWVSDEAWGWATYHYGRWYYDDDYGWAWVPGYTWAPAWVAWRHSPTYVGWAPIPPDIDIDVRVGFHFDIGLVSTHIRPTHWCFMQEQYFVEPDCSRYVVSPVGNTVIINNTTVINNYTVVNKRIVNRNIDVHEVERRTHRAVPHYRVARADSVDHHGRVERDTLRVFAPSVKPEPRGVKAPPREIRERVNLAAVKQRHHEQVRTLETSLSRQAQEIKAGRRAPDAPAPELVSISERDRRGRTTTSGPATRPGTPGVTPGRTQPGQPTQPGASGRTAPEVKPPSQRGGKSGVSPRIPAPTGEPSGRSGGKVPPMLDPMRRGTIPPSRSTPSQPEPGTTKSGVATTPGQTPARTMPGREPASELRNQRLQERDNFRRGGSVPERSSGVPERSGSLPAPSGVIKVMPPQSRTPRGYESAPGEPGMSRPETSGPEGRGGSSMRGYPGPYGRSPRGYESGPGMMPPGSRSYGSRPGEIRVPQPRSEVAPPPMQREVTPPARTREVPAPSFRPESLERHSEPAPALRTRPEMPRPMREAPEPAARRSEPEHVAPRAAPEVRRSEPERVAPRAESHSSPSRGSGRERDKDKGHD